MTQGLQLLTRWRMLRSMKTIGLRELRPSLAATMKDVEAGSSVVVTRRNLPRAVIVPIEEYERLHAQDVESRLGVVDELQASA